MNWNQFILKITYIYKLFSKKIVKNRIELKINQIIFNLNGEFNIIKRKMPDINLKNIKVCNINLWFSKVNFQIFFPAPLNKEMKNPFFSFFSVFKGEESKVSWLLS